MVTVFVESLYQQRIIEIGINSGGAQTTIITVLCEFSVSMLTLAASSAVNKTTTIICHLPELRGSKLKSAVLLVWGGRVQLFTALREDEQKSVLLEVSK